MWIEELIAKCPRFSKVLLYVNTGVSDAYLYADPGDVLQLLEHRGDEATGRSIVALVLRGSEAPRKRGESEASAELGSNPARVVGAQRS